MCVFSYPVVMMGMYSTWWIGPLKVTTVNLVLLYIYQRIIIFQFKEQLYFKLIPPLISFIISKLYLLLYQVIFIPMKKFNPIQYNRDRWGDTAKIKKHSRLCPDHKYCNVEYEWAEEKESHDESVACVGRE